MFSHNPKLLRITCWIGFLVPIYVIFVDLPMISKELHIYYIFGRLGTSLVCALAILDSYKRESSNQIIFPFIALTLYAIHGQFFLPCYYLAYMQTVLAFGLFFPMKRSVYLSILVFGWLLMTAAIIISEASYSLDSNVTTKFKFDAIMGVSIVAVLAYFGHMHIIGQRIKKEKALNQFFEIGKHTSVIVHDLKGRTFAPYNYSKMLWSELSKVPENKPLAKIAKKLFEEIDSLKKYVLEINQLPGRNNQEEETNVYSIVESIKILYKSKLNNLNLKMEGNISLKTKPSLLKVIFANILINSAENAGDKNNLNPEVVIELKNNVIKLKDNGGGFSFNTLSKLQNKEMVTEKEEGSGLGLMIVRDYMKELGGNVRFYNEESGAVVELIFKEENVNETKHFAS